LPTIISRAKEMGFYKSKDKKGKPHDREVQSEYVGQLIQHDSSCHKFSPYEDSLSRSSGIINWLGR
ncbi:MAG TPA: hypothetical protein PLB53_01105, partial [Candidatus Atribacteria bacterium]|nr:hypothetical protein [Candidatus Atribacteria bacterium]